MTDLDPSAVIREHNQHSETGCFWSASAHGTHCQPYRLAEALVAAQEDVARLSAYSAAAFDQRDAAQDALAANEAKVTRADVLLAYVGKQYGRLLAAHAQVVMDTPEDRALHAAVIETFEHALTVLADCPLQAS